MEEKSYYAYTEKSRLDKAINSLLGIIEGITIDGVVNDREMNYLMKWIREHDGVREQHPYNELLPILAKALQDGILDEEERLDIRWMCEKLRSEEYHDLLTVDMQRLHAILGAIAADAIITENELRGMADWIEHHDHLRKCWPYDEIDSLITTVLRDKKIDEAEHRRLLQFFAEFTDISDRRTIVTLQPDEITIQGVCAVCPEIVFPGSFFCFTGASARYTRQKFEKITAQLNGKVSNSVTQKLNYLVIGAAGNPCWAYACYGRKVEAAVKLRKQGHKLLLVHENDFYDAAMDIGWAEE
jgi:hypothetical protein